MKQLALHILSLFKLSKVGFLIVISFTLTLPLTLHAQTYPAIVTVNIQPPFSPYLTDFLQIGQERVFLNVNFLDQSEPSWRPSCASQSRAMVCCSRHRGPITKRSR